jgi:hypothetical protein
MVSFTEQGHQLSSNPNLKDNIFVFVRFEVFTAVTMKKAVSLRKLSFFMQG